MNWCAPAFTEGSGKNHQTHDLFQSMLLRQARRYFLQLKASLLDELKVVAPIILTLLCWDMWQNVFETVQKRKRWHFVSGQGKEISSQGNSEKKCSWHLLTASDSVSCKLYFVKFTAVGFGSSSVTAEGGWQFYCRMATIQKRLLSRRLHQDKISPASQGYVILFCQIECSKDTLSG